MAFDKSKLLANRVPTGEIEIPGVGTLKVRGLSRQELIDAQKWEGLEQERKILTAALIDPKLTEDEVAQWQAGSPANEINDVAMRINELSGIAQGAAKESFKSVRSES